MKNKRLLIMRHAKSSWDQLDLDDFQRPLLPKGESRTNLVSDALKEMQLIPDQIICSPAVRALTTAKLVMKNLDIKEDKLITEQNLYFRSEDDYFNTVFACPNEIETLMIVGHNPMITSFSNFFLTEKIENLPTSGIIGLEFECEKWEDIAASSCNNIARLFPKKMKS
jgi:phosphohistidine phosphatase